MTYFEISRAVTLTWGMVLKHTLPKGSPPNYENDNWPEDDPEHA